MKILLPVYDLTKNILDVVLRGASFKKKPQQMTTKGIENIVRFTYFENNSNTSKCKLPANKSIIES